MGWGRLDRETKLAAWIGKNVMEPSIVNVPLSFSPLTRNVHPASNAPAGKYRHTMVGSRHNP